MGRIKSVEHRTDPATGRSLPPGVMCRGPFQYRARKLIDGSRVTKTFETARLAKEWLEETEASIRRSDYVDRRPLDHMIVAELVQKFVDICMQDGGKRRGAAEDRAHIPAIKGDAIGALTLAKLTPAAVRGFRDRQQEKYAAATVVKRLNLLATIIAHARAEWDLPMLSNPACADAVSRPDGADVKRSRRLLVPSPASMRLAASLGDDPPPTEESLLLDTISKSENAWDLWLTKWAIAQATRQGEALGLRWRDVDLDRKIITIHGRVRRGTKNFEHLEERKAEVRPLMPDAIAILASVEPKGGAIPGELVFSVGDYRAFRVRWGRIVSKASARLTGLPKELGYLCDLTYHDLRHEATSRLAKIYKNPLDLKRVTGHRDLKSLDRYYQPDMSELAELAV